MGKAGSQMGIRCAQTPHRRQAALAGAQYPPERARIQTLHGTRRISAQNDDLEMMRLLLDHGAETAPMKVTSTALDRLPVYHCACRSGNLATVELLLERGADVESLSHEGTPLAAALRNVVGFGPGLDIIKLLLEKGAQPQSPRNADLTGRWDYRFLQRQKSGRRC
ncbi:hypothetical protein C8J57DRAFT_1459408 [Mycena rebaudengoi]|nr:hypothetical protein C8J57DRAFT_1459408 [Mycena rebaudengoi]